MASRYNGRASSHSSDLKNLREDLNRAHTLIAIGAVIMIVGTGSALFSAFRRPANQLDVASESEAANQTKLMEAPDPPNESDAHTPDAAMDLEHDNSGGEEAQPASDRPDAASPETPAPTPTPVPPAVNGRPSGVDVEGLPSTSKSQHDAASGSTKRATPPKAPASQATEPDLETPRGATAPAKSRQMDKSPAAPSGVKSPPSGKSPTLPSK